MENRRTKMYKNGMFVSFSEYENPKFAYKNISDFSIGNHYIFPGLADVHVHLREPGFSYKETIKTGSLAAAAGGYTAVLSMPNLDPVPDCLESLRVQLDKIRTDAVIGVYPYGSITRGEKGKELSAMDELAPYVAGFSDDGRGVQDTELTELAMKKAKSLGKIIVAHCEDESLLGENDRGESEWRAVERDLKLVSRIGCSYHVCHVSTKESIDLIRSAKRAGLDVTCETAPHYIMLDDSMIGDHGRFKMNPPIKRGEDREAIIAALLDGTIDMIATDHAPHSAKEKSAGYAASLNGVTGLEAALPVLYTGLVKSGIMSLEKLVDLMSTSPRKRFSLPCDNEISDDVGYFVFAPDEKHTICGESFESMGKCTPFEGAEVYGKVKMTAYKGEIVWQDK